MDIDRIVSEVIAEYYAAIPNKSVPHPKIVLSFSAVPGSGKTVLAHKLRDDLKACYIQADGIRTMLRERDVDLQKVVISEISSKISKLIFENDANKLIILDASIDRTWSQFFERVKHEGATPCVIRLNVPDGIVKIRQQKRDGVSKTEQERERFKGQFEVSRRSFTADLELEVDYDYSEVLRKVKGKLGLVTAK